MKKIAADRNYRIASSERQFLIDAKYVEDEFRKLFFVLENRNISMVGEGDTVRGRLSVIERKLTEMVADNPRECTIQYFKDALSSTKSGIETLGLRSKPSKQSTQHLKNAFISVRDGRTEADRREMLQEMGSSPYDCSPVQGVI